MGFVDEYGFRSSVFAVVSVFVAIVTELDFRNILILFGVVLRHWILLVQQILPVLSRILKLVQGFLGGFLSVDDVLEIWHFVGALRDRPLVFLLSHLPLLDDDVGQEESHHEDGDEVDAVVD